MREFRPFCVNLTLSNLAKPPCINENQEKIALALAMLKQSHEFACFQPTELRPDATGSYRGHFFPVTAGHHAFAGFERR
jgi:hypothetical protein